MPSGLRPADIPRLRTAVTVYKVSSIITGTFLLLVVLMMVLRYGFGVDIAWSPAYGFDLQPQALIKDAALTNVSLILLTTHGWLYVVYLACDFVMWRLSRYSFARFLFIALGGIVPLLSFFLERRVPRDIERRIAAASASAERVAA